MASEIAIDATVFMGMHSADESTRVRCKNLFVRNLHGTLLMSLEQVGLCDDVVWQYERSVQDGYYPFMDNMHTDMKIDRFPYTSEDFQYLGGDGLPVTQRLAVAAAVNRSAVLHTVSARLLERAGTAVRVPPEGPELAFPGGLELLYQASLVLRCTPERW